MAKKRKKPEYLQGKFTPLHPEKYVGNVKNIIYRSSYELAFLRILDKSPSILKYSSEELSIPYYNPMKMRKARYFPDFLIEMKVNGKVSRKLIEIKPAHQIAMPRQTKGKKMQTYMKEAIDYSVNQAKWKAAKEWCKERHIEFVVITRDTQSKFIMLNEEQLGI
jgi:hypothetical protein